jgi:RNA polymerase sigma factor (sigma-70 family)
MEELDTYLLRVGTADDRRFREWFTESPSTSTKEKSHPPRQRDVIGRHGASLNELEALYRTRFDVFARVAVSVMGDPERARDAVQEAFATAVRKRRSFRNDGPLEAWVWRIVLNAARSDVRRSTPAVGYAEPHATNGHPERDAELRVALTRLPERQRIAVFLRYYADLDYAAIAEALGIHPGTVAATLNSAHAALRTQLEEVRT